jgi:hypothetical protein
MICIACLVDNGAEAYQNIESLAEQLADVGLETLLINLTAFDTTLVKELPPSCAAVVTERFPELEPLLHTTDRQPRLFYAGLRGDREQVCDLLGNLRTPDQFLAGNSVAFKTHFLLIVTEFKSGPLLQAVLGSTDAVLHFAAKEKAPEIGLRGKVVQHISYEEPINALLTVGGLLSAAY